MPTYPIPQPPDNAAPYTYTQPLRDGIAAANDHQIRITALESAGVAVPPTILHRLVEVNGAYPARPSTGHSDFLGITDPSSVMQTGDTWTQLSPTVPNAPTIGAATGGNAQATVAFTAPTWNGGATITGYTVTSTPGSLTGTGSASPITVTGLTNGTSYTFKVKATNSVGTGVDSAASNSVTPTGGGGSGSFTRFFDGVDDEVTRSAGALVGLTYGTFAVMYRRPAVDTDMRVFAMHDSNGSNRAALGLTQYNYPELILGATADVANTTMPAQGAGYWTLLVAKKPTGTVAARMGLYNFTSQVWSHDSTAATFADMTALASGATVTVKANFAPYPTGLLAVVGVWKNAIPWATDGALQSAGLHTSIANWISSSPTALWEFNQASVATPVTDLTGGGANQTSIVGTSVDSTTLPPGFTF